MQFEQGHVFGIPYKYVAVPISNTLVSWMFENFGPEGHPLTVNQRWYFRDFHIWFRDDEDVIMFTLRWS